MYLLLQIYIAVIISPLLQELLKNLKEIALLLDLELLYTITQIQRHR